MEKPRSRTLYIKNMVCRRCVMVVEQILTRRGFPPTRVVLGEADLPADPTPAQRAAIEADLRAVGFETVDDRRARLIESIRHAVIAYARAEEGTPRQNLSAYLEDSLHLDAHYLSDLFSRVEGKTVERFFIEQRIERIKELLVYDHLQLGEIAVRLGYSSTAYLSAQFKRETGTTVTAFLRARKLS